MTHDRITWPGFLRRHLREHGVPTLLRYGGQSPSRTRYAIESDFREHRIDAESRHIRMVALAEWEYRFNEELPLVDYKDPKDWRDLGNGAKMRVDHDLVLEMV